MVSKIEDKFKSGKNIGEKTLTTKWAAEIKWTEQQKTKLAKSYSASILAFHKTDQMAVIEEYTKRQFPFINIIFHTSLIMCWYLISLSHTSTRTNVNNANSRQKKKEIQKR